MKGTNFEDSEKWYDEEYCIKEVQKHPLSIILVKNKTEKVCLAVVKQYGFALAFITDEQTEKICLEAVKENIYAFQFVRDKTPRICKKVLSQNGLLLMFVEKQTPEMCKIAVENNPKAITFVDKKYRHLFLEYIKALPEENKDV